MSTHALQVVHMAMLEWNFIWEDKQNIYVFLMLILMYYNYLILIICMRKILFYLQIYSYWMGRCCTVRFQTRRNNSNIWSWSSRVNGLLTVLNCKKHPNTIIDIMKDVYFLLFCNNIFIFYKDHTMYKNKNGIHFSKKK